MIVTLLITLVTGIALGVVGGGMALARWFVWRISDPEVARAMLKRLYHRTHPHWLQLSEEDKTRVCPCCGWSETEGLASTEKCRGDAR